MQILGSTIDRFGIDAQDACNLLTVMAGIKQQDGLNTFTDAPLGGVFVASLQIIALLVTQIKELVTHAIPPDE